MKKIIFGIIVWFCMIVLNPRYDVLHQGEIISVSGILEREGDNYIITERGGNVSYECRLENGVYICEGLIFSYKIGD